MSMTPQRPPIAVHIVWHMDDAGAAKPIIDELSVRLSRDVEKPFSRNLNLPIFLYTNLPGQELTIKEPIRQASQDIVLFFSSVNTCGEQCWRDYATSIAGLAMPMVIFALDIQGLKLPKELASINAIRGFAWASENKVQNALLTISHEIYRHGLVELSPTDQGRDSSINVFLSHAKNDEKGRAYAEAVKKFIDGTNLNRFFDADEISPGFRFDAEIVGSIAQSTLISFVGDNYSSRYWCQREVLCAKEHARPMISVNCAQDCEDRVFPSNSNVPCLQVPFNTPPSEASVLKILSHAMIETIRFEHSMASLNYYQAMGWIPQDCALIARPPELRQFLKLKRELANPRVCYPEPPIFAEEADWHQQLGVETFTPLWSPTDRTVFESINVGISISEPNDAAIIGKNLPRDQLTRLAQDVARHILARSGQLHYGGGLRPSGFTEFILDEAVALSNRQISDTIFVHNHLAWPLYQDGEELKRWIANYGDILRTECVPIPEDVIGSVDVSQFLSPKDTESQYVWSRCLTEMRMALTKELDAQVCVGGRLSGYKGKLPGVLEEIILAIKNNLPTYVLGAFGGVASEFANFLSTQNFPDAFTEAWQVDVNQGYGELQRRAGDAGHAADYEEIASILEKIDIPSLAALSGLSCDEYTRLLNTPFIDECVHLIIKGLSAIAKRKHS